MRPTYEATHRFSQLRSKGFKKSKINAQSNITLIANNVFSTMFFSFFIARVPILSGTIFRARYSSPPFASFPNRPRRRPRDRSSIARGEKRFAFRENRLSEATNRVRLLAPKEIEDDCDGEINRRKTTTSSLNATRWCRPWPRP
jgi:hypothetical protein